VPCAVKPFGLRRFAPLSQSLHHVVSVELTEPTVGWDSVQDALGEIRAGHEEFDHFFSEMFDQLDSMSAALSDRQQHLRQSAAQSQETAAAAVANGAELEEFLENGRQQQAELRGVHEAARGQIDRLATVAAELADARSEIAATGEEILRRRDRLDADREEGPPDAAYEELREQFQQMAEQQQGLQRERAELETELEMVRSRAAELTESLAEQKRQASEQQARWADELKRMRHMLEGMSRQLAAGAFDSRQLDPQPRERPVCEVPSAAGPVEVADPVLDSVKAQFEMLQRDLARRRAGN